MIGSFGSIPLSDEVIKWAKAQRKKDVKKKGYGHFKPQGADEGYDGWWGKLGEVFVAAWADHKGYRRELHGGFDKKPDIVIEGVEFGIKTTFNRGGYDKARCLIPDQQIWHPWDYWLFVCIEEAPSRIHLVGACPPSYFLEVATGVKKGEVSWCQNDCHYLHSGSPHLLDPHFIVGIPGG